MNINSNSIDRVFTGDFFRDLSNFLNVYSVMEAEMNPKMLNNFKIGTAVLEL